MYLQKHHNHNSFEDIFKSFENIFISFKDIFNHCDLKMPLIHLKISSNWDEHTHFDFKFAIFFGATVYSPSDKILPLNYNILSFLNFSQKQMPMD